MRWPETDGEAVCPRCGFDETYNITTRRKFKCKACHHQFSVTSGTIFASRKNGTLWTCWRLSASSLMRPRVFPWCSSPVIWTASTKLPFVLAHKLREAMAQEVQTGEVLSGHVEVDGAYFGGHIRPENRKEDRKDRRLKENQTGKRRVVGGPARTCWPCAVCPFVTKI